MLLIPTPSTSSPRSSAAWSLPVPQTIDRIVPTPSSSASTFGKSSGWFGPCCSVGSVLRSHPQHTRSDWKISCCFASTYLRNRSLAVLGRRPAGARGNEPRRAPTSLPVSEISNTFRGFEKSRPPGTHRSETLGIGSPPRAPTERIPYAALTQGGAREFAGPGLVNANLSGWTRIARPPGAPGYLTSAFANRADRLQWTPDEDTAA